MILIINTSGGNLEFVLDDKYKSVAVEKQSVALPTECEKFISECGAKWSDISAIGIVIGPGSFTGIRLGIAYAKGLAMGLKIPVVGLSLFDLYLAATPDAFGNQSSPSPIHPDFDGGNGSTNDKDPEKTPEKTPEPTWVYIDRENNIYHLDKNCSKSALSKRDLEDALKSQFIPCDICVK